MTLPNFGLMTKADKQKLDAIPSGTLVTVSVANGTYLTKADASNTYVTLAELQAYVQAAKNN